MKRSEAALYLIGHRSVSGVYAIENSSAFRSLVDNGMAEKKRSRMFGIEYITTAATPLALLTPTQFLCAQQLVKSGEIGSNAVPRAQKAHMDKLVENGLAAMDRNGSAWKATWKLIAAVNCWYKAKGVKP